MLRTKFQSENIQRAITKKLLKIELLFFSTALLLNKFYMRVMFQVPSFYTFGDMLRTKI